MNMNHAIIKIMKTQINSHMDNLTQGDNKLYLELFERISIEITEESHP